MVWRMVKLFSLTVDIFACSDKGSNQVILCWWLVCNKQLKDTRVALQNSLQFHVYIKSNPTI